MSARAAWAMSALIAVALASLYAAVLLWLSRNTVFLPATPFESAILWSQLARLVVMLSVPRLRRMNGLIVIDFFAGEMLVVPAVVFLVELLGDRSYLPLAGQVIPVWTSAFLLVYPVFAIVRIAELARAGGRIATLIPSATGVFTVLLLVISATTQSTGTPGLLGMTNLVIAAVTKGASAAAAEGPAVSLAGIGLYLGLILYSTFGAKGAPPARDALLLFPLLGTASAVAWGVLTGRLWGGALWTFSVPSLALVATMWVGTRAKKKR